MLGLVPALLAGMATVASPAPALAAASVIENGTTTYVVNTAKSEIDVTIKLSIKNNDSEYYYYATAIDVEVQAGAIKATSNAGPVQQSVVKTGDYYREIRLTYPDLYYGQTRAITVTYAIPAAPRSPGDYRAGKAYAELCAVGNGTDSGSVNVVVPDGFDVVFTDGTELSQSSDTKGVRTYGSGIVVKPYSFWTCLEATNPSRLVSTELTAGGQSFDILAWPEDSTWASTVSADVRGDVQKLEDLTGLKMPGGTIDITEAGDSELGDYAGSYAPRTKTATVTEDTDNATVSHELSHIWFNSNLFTATWMDEGFAGYSEKVAGAGKYEPCGDPGEWPGAGSPNLTTWNYLDINSTAVDQNVTDWQYAASCYLVAEVADKIGPANFHTVLEAASSGEIAYVGASPAEQSPLGGPPISPKTLLDLIDERGMVPAGIKDLDEAQKLFADYGIFSSADLDARSTARANYHKLVDTAGTWKMPLAVRGPMASWDFSGAQTAMDTMAQILALRAEIQKNVSGLSLDGTPIQTQFEAAKTQADLDAVLALIKSEADAAGKVAQAKQLNDGSHSIFQTIGLLGTDPGASIAKATSALKSAKPDDARIAAQQAIDTINGSADQGLTRFGAVLGLLLALLALVLFVLWHRRRRASVAMASAAGAAAYPFGPPPGYGPSTWPPPPPPAPPQGWPPPPAPQVGHLRPRLRLRRHRVGRLRLRHRLVTCASAAGLVACAPASACAATGLAACASGSACGCPARGPSAARGRHAWRGRRLGELTRGPPRGGCPTHAQRGSDAQPRIRSTEPDPDWPARCLGPPHLGGIP